MSFSWPLALLALITVPALLIAYPILLRRRRRPSVVHSSVALIRTAGPARFPWRRHLPVALVIAALVLLGMASARPQLRMPVPTSGSAVILALDVSGSMCATDVNPNRLAAAQSAVRDFLTGQDSDMRIGLVIFSGFAEVAVPPTRERKPLLQAVNSLTTGRGTTIGAAILKSVEAISEIDPDVQRPGQGTELKWAGHPSPTPAPGDPVPVPSPGAISDQTLAPGTGSAPEIVVLLTDGANTAGIEPVPAARVAAASGVRVFPIGFGTTHPTSMSCTADQLGGTGFSGGGGPAFGGGAGGRNFLVADETTLRQVATITGGTYFGASDAGQLRNVLRDLPRHVETTTRQIEISAGFAAAALLLILMALWAAARWSVFPS